MTTTAVWNWNGFEGSAAALKYNRRDLPCLEEVMALTPGRTAVVQAGGNLGIFAKRLAAAFATVYCFEPAADLFGILCRNAPELNIMKFQAALGFDRGLVGMSRIRRDGKLNHHEGITHVAGPGNVPMLRIDDLGLSVCDLIYLDLEGGEWAALKGAVGTIARCRPVLNVEINKNLAFVGLTPDVVTTWIRALGYRLVTRMHSDDVYVPEERAA